MKPTVIRFGGSSSERLVSVASAQNVSTNLPDARLWFLSTSGEVFDVARPEDLGRDGVHALLTARLRAVR